MHKLLGSNSWDVVVVGAGAAGLMSCLELSSKYKVLLLNRNTSRRSSSRWAQGGIASVTRMEDSFESHIKDTLDAGAGLCDFDAVTKLVRQAPECVDRLQELGMEFDRIGSDLSTTLEAAHSFRRVLHVKDRTGRALVEVLLEEVNSRTNITHRRGIRVTQLWIEGNRCCGLQVLDGQMLYWIPTRAVVLATGGGGHLFENTTNPAQASGEGIALAWRAGAAIDDLEFVQFHPTALKIKDAPCFLISEALRGEGAVLIDQDGESPVNDLEGRDLAARDKLSRALAEVMRQKKVKHLGLDLKNIPSSILENRFPTILRRCRELGLNPLREAIPVAPAAHYWMGGVATNLNAETSLLGLYAVGEVASTGLHGANRLASNSLTECLVFASEMSSIQIGDFPSFTENIHVTSIRDPGSNRKQSNEFLMQEIVSLRKLCWEEAGVNRSFKGLSKALLQIKKDLQKLNQDPLLIAVNTQSKDTGYHFDELARKTLNLILDLNNRRLTSILLLEACLFRNESRGGHYRTDSSISLPFWQCHSRQIRGKGISTRPVRS